MTENVKSLMAKLLYNARLKERHIGTAKLDIEMSASFRIGGRRIQAIKYLRSAAFQRKLAEKYARNLAAARNQLLERCHD